MKLMVVRMDTNNPKTLIYRFKISQNGVLIFFSTIYNFEPLKIQTEVQKDLNLMHIERNIF